MPKKQSKRASPKKQRNVSARNKRKVSSTDKPRVSARNKVKNLTMKKNMQMCCNKMLLWMYKI